MMGDVRAANEEMLLALSHLARASILRRGEFPLSRPELAAQLDSLGDSSLASLLRGAIQAKLTRSEISRALDEVLSSPELRTRMSERGLDAARRLTWDYAARQMMDVIGKVTGR